jgi:hypothetical protein
MEVKCSNKASYRVSADRIANKRKEAGCAANAANAVNWV